MRIALLADIHGNGIALDAVLADIQQRGGVDGYWILGDLCAIGPDPAYVVERLHALPDALFVAGNADRYVTSDERPAPSFAQVRENPELIPLLAEVAGSFAWTCGYLEGQGWLQWLAELPMEQRVTLPDGSNVLLTHVAPDTLDGMGLNPSLSDTELATALKAETADLICVGHFHLALDRTYDQQRIINPGAVSNNFAPDLRAAYAILNANTQGYSIFHHRVDYDRAAVAERVRRSSNPGAGFMLQLLEGKVRASWMHRWDGESFYPALAQK